MKIIIPLLISLTLAYESYKVNVTHEQIIYWQRSLLYIEQFTGKRCTKASLMAEDRFCKKRCQLMFYYIPTAPYKNYRFYNKTTKDCQPRVICPKIFTVFYNATANKCVDMSTGDNVPGVNATPYAGNDMYEVEFVCINGHVGLYKGRNQCICDFGWKTSFVPATRQIPKFQKCNIGISIYEYLPAVIQIYYDPLLDLPYPHPADPDYWSKILINYLKQLKYSIKEWIWPNQIQLVLLVIPTEDLISEGDYQWMILGCMILGLILLISIYEKVKYTKTMEQIVAEKINQPNAEINQPNAE